MNNRQQEEWNTNLYEAASKGDCKAIVAAIAAGANANHKRRGGDTPLLVATRQGHLKAVQLLVGTSHHDTDDKVAKLDVVDDLGRTVLHMACLEPSLVEWLLWHAHHRYGKTKCSALVNRASVFGRRPLLNACRFGQGRVVELFLAAGANVLALDNDGRTTCAGHAGQKFHYRLAQKLELSIRWVQVYDDDQQQEQQEPSKAEKQANVATNKRNCDGEKLFTSQFLLSSWRDETLYWRDMFVHLTLPKSNKTLWEAVCEKALTAPKGVVALVHKSADVRFEPLTSTTTNTNTCTGPHWHVDVLTLLFRPSHVNVSV